MILLIDNYDSFAHNLARYFNRLGHATTVARNDQIGVDEVRQMNPGALVLSPGPCTPREAGVSLDLVRQFGECLPMLGVCLGHQTIAAAFGADIVRAAQPMHGRTSRIRHAGTSLFTNAPNPLTVCRYHSLIVDRATLPASLEITASTADGTIMALAHRSLPLFGLQFHPESILTEGGYDLLAAFLEAAGLPPKRPRPTLDDELRSPQQIARAVPAMPVTF